MARRRKKVEPWVPIVLFLGAALWLSAMAIQRALANAIVVTVIIFLVASILGFRYIKKKKRFEYLLDKYGDENIVEQILQKTFWQGQTAQQLVDSIGSPVSIDKKAMASRAREIWKYDQRGRNRYGLRITLDDGAVIGWDQKNG